MGIQALEPIAAEIIMTLRKFSNFFSIEEQGFCICEGYKWEKSRAL